MRWAMTERLTDLQLIYLSNEAGAYLAANSAALFRRAIAELRELRAENEGLRKEVRELLLTREAIYEAIAERFRVEDWTNPEKGITELEAYLEALADRRAETTL